MSSASNPQRLPWHGVKKYRRLDTFSSGTPAAPSTEKDISTSIFSLAENLDNLNISGAPPPPGTPIVSWASDSSKSSALSKFGTFGMPHPQQSNAPAIFSFDCPPPNSKPSHFMKLPRELRDKVYDEIGGHDIAELHPFHLRSLRTDSGLGSLPSGPYAKLLRVSKQFSAEYEERIWNQASLVMEGLRSFPLPTAAELTLK